MDLRGLQRQTWVRLGGSATAELERARSRGTEGGSKRHSQAAGPPPRCAAVYSPTRLNSSVQQDGLPDADLSPRATGTALGSGSVTGGLSLGHDFG